MTKIDVFSGFLGAGKTTLIKKLIKEAYAGEKLVLIENEFGEIGIDGGFMQEAGINVNELNSGCICCSLVGDFSKALQKVMDEYNPDRILIEPSGVGKLSDVIKAVENAQLEGAVINSTTTIVDATRCKTYMRNFGEFFNDQIEHAQCIVFSHVDLCSDAKFSTALELIKGKNPTAALVATPWDMLDGKIILESMERAYMLDKLLDELEEEEHHHHHDHGEECTCGCHGHEHEHHHDHGEECTCGCHGHEHEHHHHHHADEVFTSWGKETVNRYTIDSITESLNALINAAEYGLVLRAKGIVRAEDSKWIHFDYVPGEVNVRYGTPSIIGRLCVIGSKLNEEALGELFDV